jgi:hypothetical protein
MSIHRFVFRVSINPSQPIREEKTDSTNNQSFKNLQNIKKWNPLKAQEFIESINVNNFNDLSEKLNNINQEEINQDFINTCTYLFRQQRIHLELVPSIRENQK